jgi:hypothetical protein
MRVRALFIVKRLFTAETAQNGDNKRIIALVNDGAANV